MFERKDLADIGVIGGSGFYELLRNVEHHAVQTPYGPPSGRIAIGTYEGVRVAFLARHGRRPPLPAAPDQLPRQHLGAGVGSA